MHLLFLNASGQLGGAETAVLELLTQTKVLHPEWQISMIVGGDGPFADRVRNLGIRVILTPLPKAFAQFGDSALLLDKSLRARLAWFARMAWCSFELPAYILRLRKLIRSLQPDLIQTTGFKFHILSAWTAPRGVPVVWHLQDYLNHRPVAGLLVRWHVRKCRAVIAISSSVADDIHRVCGESIQVHRLFNSVDTERFSATGSTVDLDALSQLPPAAKGTVRVGLVGTFAYWKGHDVFLRALTKLAPEMPIRGYIVGGPIYQTSGSQYSLEQLQSRARELGLEGRVGFTGFVAERAPLMRSLDILVHASTQPEPFGMVLIEAQACGRPVIASGAGGAQEIVRDGIDGRTHDPGNVDQLAARIQELAERPILRERFGSSGRERVESLFSTKQSARLLTDIYRSILETSI